MLSPACSPWRACPPCRARLPRALCAKVYPERYTQEAIRPSRIREIRVHPRLRTFPRLYDSVLSGSVPLWIIAFSLFSTTSKLLPTHRRFLIHLFSMHYKSLFRQPICFHNLLNCPGYPGYPSPVSAFQRCPLPARRGAWHRLQPVLRRRVSRFAFRVSDIQAVGSDEFRASLFEFRFIGRSDAPLHPGRVCGTFTRANVHTNKIQLRGKCLVG